MVKKLVPNWRSNSSRTSTATSGEPTIRSRIEVEICAHTNRGKRVSFMPGARSATIVVRKLVEAMIPDTPQTARLRIQRSTPLPGLNLISVRGG